MLKSFTIDNDLSGQMLGAIEVTLYLRDGSRRWCFFMRPEALAACGDWINGTKTRIHYAAPHMIVVDSQLSIELIEQALRHIEEQGELPQCSLPLV